MSNKIKYVIQYHGITNHAIFGNIEVIEESNEEKIYKLKYWKQKIEEANNLKIVAGFKITYK